MLLRNWLDGFLARFSLRGWGRSCRRSGRLIKMRRTALRSPESLEVRTLLSASSATFKLQTGAANPLNGQDVGSASTLAIGDINGDGLPDVIAGTIIGTFAYYKNTGTATSPVFTLQTGAANPLNGQDVGTYSNPTLGDLNGDGLADLISGRTDGTFAYYKNTGTATSPVFTLQTGAANPLDGQDVGLFSAPDLRDLNGDGLLDLISGRGDGTFVYYKNTGTATSPVFTLQSGAANPLNGQNTGGYSTPSLGDLDGDGLVDIISGRTDGTFAYYKNTGTATSPAFTFQSGATTPLNGQDVGAFSAPKLGDLNGDGRVDLLSGNNDGVFTYYLNIGPFRPTLERQYGSANPLAGQDLGYGSTPTLGDLTGDGLIDLVAGAGDGSFKFYKNTGTPATPVFTLQTGVDNPLNGQTFGFSSAPTLGDLNGDGLLDLIAGSWDGTFAYYKNTGTATNPAFTRQTGATNPLDGQDIGGYSIPTLGDLNGDGLLDLIVGDQDGTFSYYKNTGTTTNPAFTLQSGATNPMNGRDVGKYSSPTLGDLNGDGLQDLVVGEYYGQFSYFLNTGTITTPVFTRQLNNWNPLNGQDLGDYSHPALGDLDGDGTLDLIAGNKNGNFLYYENVPASIVPRLVPQTGAANPLNGQDIGSTATPTSGDLNGDGLLDLIVGKSAGTFSYYLNTGTATAPAFTLQSGAANPLNSQDVGSYSAPVLGDLSGDGLLDLIVGNQIGKFSYYKNTGTVGSPTYTLQTGAANPLDGQDVGFYSTPTLGDLNGDGLVDLIAGNSDGTFSYYKNTGTASSPAFTLQSGAADPLDGQVAGAYATPRLKDLDGDGLIDLVVGNNAGTFSYFKNTGTTNVPVFTLQTGAANPLNGVDVGAYAAPSLGDLDGDGRADLIVGENSGVFFYYRSLPQTAPVLNPTIHPQINISEDIASAANTGLSLPDLVATFGAGSWYDVDSGALQGIAIIAADNTLGNWQYSTNGGTNWTNIGNSTSASAFLLASDANARLRFAPNANANGTIPDGLTFVAWDQTTGSNLGTANASARGGNTPFSTAAATINLNVTPVNDPPAGTDKTVTTPEDTDYLFTAADFGFTDPSDSPANNFAAVKITSLPAAGSLKLDVTSVTVGQLIPVASIGNLKFTPASNANGTGYASFTFQLQDDGGTANSGVDLDQSPNTMTVDVTPLADTPSITNTTTNEDTQSTTGLVISRNPADGSEVSWFKITNITNGTLYLNNGTTAIANNSFISFAEANAGLKFTPAANLVSPTNSFSFQLQASVTSSDAGLGGGIVTAAITVTPVQDAPVLNNAGNPTLTSILPNTPDASNPGNSIVSILANMTATGGSLTDPDAGALQGIAISSVDNSHGTWQFTTNNGTLWTDFGTPSASAARLLAANTTTKIRFKPNAGFVGTATFLFVGWDQTAGTNGGTASIISRGGSKPYSLGTETGNIAVNTAPEMTSTGTPTLTAIPQNIADTSNPGTTVTQIIASMTSSGGSYTDADAGSLQGIAVTLVDNSHGTWQFTTNNGTTWTDFGTPSAPNARLLIATASTKIRFKPALDYVGNATFVFVAWDVSTGTNGSTASATARGGARPFSLVYDTATINVFVPNAAPVLNAAGNPTLTSITKNIIDANNTGTLISQIIANLTATGGSITDTDPGALQGIAITSAVQTNGTWQYTINNGTTWLDFGTPAAATARLLASDANTRIRFKPNANYTGQATFLFVAWDQSTGVNGGTLSASKRGGLTPFSLNTDTASITVTP